MTTSINQRPSNIGIQRPAGDGHPTHAPDRTGTKDGDTGSKRADRTDSRR